jgi:hypothetical protein
MITQLQRRFIQAQIFLSDTRGELDEKALLITFFVLIAL